jgi:hypothetical protein
MSKLVRATRSVSNAANTNPDLLREPGNYAVVGKMVVTSRQLNQQLTTRFFLAALAILS